MVCVYTEFYRNRILETQEKSPDAGLRMPKHISLFEQPIKALLPLIYLIQRQRNLYIRILKF